MTCFRARFTNLITLVAVAACWSESGAAARAQALEQVEQDVRRQTAAPPAPVANPPAPQPPAPQPPAPQPPGPTEVSEPPAAPPGYLGLLADERGERGRGLRVIDVFRGSPAERAGLVPGDLITSINGATMRNLDDMARVMSPLTVGRSVDFQIQRSGAARQVSLVLGARPTKTDGALPPFGRQAETLPSPGPMIGNPLAPQPPGPSMVAPGLAPPGAVGPARAPSPGGPLLGVRTVPLDGERRGLFKIPADVFGALVTGVTVGSAADKAGVQPGVLITSFDGQPVDSPATLSGLVRGAGGGRQIEITYRDQNGETHRTLATLAAGAPADPSAAMTPEPAQSPNGSMPAEIGLPQEIPPGPGLFPAAGVSDKQLQIDALQQRVDELESRIRRLEAAQAAKP